MKFLKLTLMSLLLGFSSSALAGLYLEPGVTYEQGDNELVWPSPLNSSTGKTKGMGVNLKLGFHAGGILFAGLDGSYSKPKFENSANNYDADATSSTYGAVLGLQMPLAGLRIWGGYVFGGELNPEESGGADVKFENAKGLKLGAGIRILLVSVNFEYMDLKYDSVIEQAGPISGTLDEQLQNKVGMVSVSFPLTF